MKNTFSGMVRKDSGLSHRQAAALPYIASEPTLARGANAAQVARSTLARWMRDPAFRAELEYIRNNMADLAFAELEGLALKSVIRLAELLESENENVAHRALKTAVATTQTLREQRALRHRLDLLENAQIMMRQQR
ncbi:MAG: hypothetical protein F4185_04345 [Chloroflexi bacterium]|nr:hypothetical protein [Chloroflexota bacterium]MYF65157.1 hypothetical protein [Chloroflexota bacterium]MYK35357.1 hypothetical protein [Chloroflexota bacterium]